MKNDALRGDLRRVNLKQNLRVDMTPKSLKLAIKGLLGDLGCFKDIILGFYTNFAVSFMKTVFFT